MKIPSHPKNTSHFKALKDCLDLKNYLLPHTSHTTHSTNTTHTTRIDRAAIIQAAALICLILISSACGNSQPPQFAGEARQTLKRLKRSTSLQGIGTHFDNLGYPTGGCGVPQAQLDSQNFVALNVQNTPNNYGAPMPRPITDPATVGAWNNGLNCGRWIKVRLGRSCSGGDMSGAPGNDFCQGGVWQQDQYTGATLNMLVADSCQDNNKWCRDSEFHLDLATGSLSQFLLNGDLVSGLLQNWKNPQLSWFYIDAPNYTGDVKIGFAMNSNRYWPTIILTHLKRGVHRVEQKVNGQWEDAKMMGDLGQSYTLNAATSPQYQIRVYDAHDELVQGGSIFQFNFPSACGGSCGQAYTAADSQLRLPPEVPLDPSAREL